MLENDGNSDDRSLPPELDDTDAALLQLLVAGASVADAARDLGLHPNTIYRRRARPAFQSALIAARADRFRPVANVLHRQTTAAIERLVAIRDSETASVAERHRACVEILELALKYEDRANVAERLDSIQAQIETLRDRQSGGDL